MEKNDCDIRIAELQQENEALSRQVRHLIKAEGQLYRYQEQLDAQLKEYKSLYELNQEFNKTFDIRKICRYAVSYATRGLEFERAVLFERAADTGAYHACAVEGYYDELDKSSVGALVIEQKEPFLSPLFAGKEYLLCKTETENKELADYGAKLRMDEYFIYRLGAPSAPFALLAVGNSTENAPFYREVSESPATLLSIGNLAGLISASLEKYIYARELETALEQERLAKAKFRKLFEQASISMQIFSSDGRVLEVNRAWEKLWGIKPDALREYNILRDRQLSAKGIMPYIEKGFAGEPVDIPPVLYDPAETGLAGQPRWVNAFIYPVKAEDGCIHEIVLMHLDVTETVHAENALRESREALEQAYAGLEIKVQERTRELGEANNVLRREIIERRRAEEALLASEKRIRDLIEATSDWVWEIDDQGIYTYASPQISRILGYEPEEVLGKTPFDLMAPEEAERLAAIFRNIAASQLPFSFLENINLHKNGARVIMETSGVPFFDAAGNFRGYRGIDRDITERKKVEEELQRAQKLESIGLLAGGIAHDFNNILTAIKGNIELARRFLPPGDKAAARLAVAEQASARASGLARQLLTFARGGAPITRTTDIPHLVREAVELAPRGSMVKVEYCFAEDLQAVEADESQLSQAINNLAINAAEAMPEGGVIRITAVNESLPPGNSLSLPPGEYIRIEIKDQGNGIPAELQERIFDPYFTTKERGSGLGLAITFSIVKRHGGTITIESAPGQGSTFSVYLPSRKEAVTARPEPEHQEISEGSGRILVMDDEEEAGKVAAEMLLYLGYQVETVKDGSGAIAAYRQAVEEGEPFAAVIVDLTVPAGMGGKETGRRLLEMDPQAKVIVASDYANDQIMSEYADYGFKKVIPKPYKLNELGRVLREVISEGETVGA
jgi:two-component system, cell cycle sensor histidine kinase and response regulator CckA